MMLGIAVLGGWRNQYFDDTTDEERIELAQVNDARV